MERSIFSNFTRVELNCSIRHVSLYDILGDGKVLIQDSDYGKLATIICYDAAYPNFVRQAGKANVDSMLIPVHDWEAITPLHAGMASSRAIENGFSMIRVDHKGLSTAVDYHGNILSQMNDFTAPQLLLLFLERELFRDSAWLRGPRLAGTFCR